MPLLLFYQTFLTSQDCSWSVAGLGWELERRPSGIHNHGFRVPTVAGLQVRFSKYCPPRLLFSLVPGYLTPCTTMWPSKYLRKQSNNSGGVKAYPWSPISSVTLYCTGAPVPTQHCKYRWAATFAWLCWWHVDGRWPPLESSGLVRLPRRHQD